MNAQHTIEVEHNNTMATVTLDLDISDASFSHAFGIKRETDIEVNGDGCFISEFCEWDEDGETISTTATSQQEADLIEKAYEVADLSEYNVYG